MHIKVRSCDVKQDVFSDHLIVIIDKNYYNKTLHFPKSQTFSPFSRDQQDSGSLKTGVASIRSWFTHAYIHEGAYGFDLVASCLRVLPETGVPRGCDLRCSAGLMISLP